MNVGVNRKSQQHFDWPLFVIAYALGAFGVLAVTVATYTSGSTTSSLTTLLARITGSEYGRWQAIFLLVSPVAVFGMMALDYRVLGKMSNVLFLGGLGLLLLVLTTSQINGVKGWFSIMWDRTVQPAELVKIAIIISFAKFLARKDDPVVRFNDFLRMGLIVGLPLLLILVQGEMGSAIVIIVFFFAMMLIGGVRMKIILGLLLAGVAVLIPAVFAMRASGSYRFDRILGFFFPSQASADATYQAANSMVSIGSGGLYGQGMFKDGSMSSLNFVPQDHTDFVFSAIGETMGFVGCAIVVVLYAMLLYRMLILAVNTADKFGQLIIVGVLAMMLFHIFQNIGMTIGVMPVMGIPLPFISYGGSNLITNMAGVGLVLNVTIRKPQPRKAMADAAMISQYPRTMGKKPLRRT